MNEYDKQAENFINKTGLKIEKQYLGHMPYFSDDDEYRAVFKITFKCRNREFSFNYGNSIMNSWVLYEGYKQKSLNLRPALEKVKKDYSPPSDYDILSAMEKYNPESFDYFCDKYSYSNDSIKALKVYHKVQKQYYNMVNMFTDEEIELLRDIQ